MNTRKEVQRMTFEGADEMAAEIKRLKAERDDAIAELNRYQKEVVRLLPMEAQLAEERRVKMKDGLLMKYFVLNPSSKDDAHAHASQQAMLAYARAIKSQNSFVANGLQEWVAQAVEESAK